MTPSADILTTSCNGHCDQFTPCIVQGTGVECLDSNVDESGTFRFRFSEISAIGAVELGPNTTHVVLTDGHTSEELSRGGVANIVFDPTFVIAGEEITDINIRNLNISSADRLPPILPKGTVSLRLENTLIKEFPTAPLLQPRSLLDLNLDSNSIEEIGAGAYSDSLQSLSLQNNEMDTFQGYFPSLQTLILRHNKFTAIPEGIYHLPELKTLQMTHNLPLSRIFTREQVDFLRKLAWDLQDQDFVPFTGCELSSDRIHGVSVCIKNNPVHTAVARKLYDYESYACPGRYSGGVLAGCIIGTIVAMLAVGAFVWRWQKQKPQGVPSSQEKSRTTNSSVSVWQDPQLLSIQLRAEEIEDVRKIGGGAFADVWLVKYRNTQLLASKRLRKVHETHQTTQNFLEEIKMAAKFDHPNIVKLIGAAWTVESDLQALSEYMVGGDVREFLIYPQTPRTWTARKLQIALDVVEALVYLHSFIPPVVHRDLKSRNILLSKEMRAKLTDFGVSRIMSEENTMTQGVGTSRWEAPEVLTGKDDYNQQADIFSFGVVLSELDTHAIPYDDARGPSDNTLANVAILQKIAMGVIRPSFSTRCPPDIRALADRCLAHNPDDRPSAPEVAYVLRTTTI